jgi:hypothetical protein
MTFSNRTVELMLPSVVTRNAKTTTNESPKLASQTVYEK